MTRNQIRRPKISIERIGKKRFWSGVVIGLVLSTVIGLYFDYFRGYFGTTNPFSDDFTEFTEKETQFYDYFFAALSILLGLSISIWTWLGNQKDIKPRSQIYRKLGRTISMLYFWVIILVVTRFGSIIWIVPVSLQDYSNDLGLYSHYQYLFILFTSVFFLNIWFCVRMVYKSLDWIIYSLIVCAILTVVFATVFEKINLPQQWLL
jgi:hypothetical protein